MSGIGRTSGGTSSIGATTRVDDAGTGAGAPSEAKPAVEGQVVRGSGSFAALGSGMSGTLTQARLGEPAGPAATSAPKGTEISLDQVTKNALDSVRALGPDKVDLGDPTRLLSGVKDGDVQMDVPLKAGKYRIKGVALEIPEGTVIKLSVQVRDGKLVPAEDERGRKLPGGGTRAEIVPPLDLPLWIDGNGAYLRDKGNAQAAFYADLGGFFDVKFKTLPSTDLATIVSGLGKGDVVPKPTDEPKGPLTKKEERQERREARREERAAKRGEQTEIVPENLLDVGKIRFNVGQVTLKDDVVDTGTTRIDLAAGSKVSISGTLEDAAITGDVGIDSVAMNQDGVEVKVGAGRASFEARVTRTSPSTLTASTKLTKLEGVIDGASIERPRTPGDTDPDRVALGKTRIKNATFDAEMSLEENPGSLLPHVVGTKTSGSLEAEGDLAGAKLSFADGRGDATFRAGPSKFQGKISMGGGKLTVDGSAQGVSLDVRDLQAGAASDKIALDLHHASLTGDARIKFDAGTKMLDVDVDAKSIDARIDDLRAGSPEVTADLGRTDVTGSGKVRIQSQGGILLDGKLTAKASIDDLKVNPREGTVGLDFAQGSTVTGTLRHLESGAGGLTLEGTGDVSADLEKFDLNLPEVKTSGTVHVAARTDIKVGGRDLLLSNVNGQVSVAIDDGKIAPKGADLALDLGKGSKVALNVTGTTIGTRGLKSATDIKLGKGSKVDAVLDGGEVVVAGRKLTIEKGSTARVDITSLDVPIGKKPEIRGKLTVDAKVSGASASLTDIPGVKGVKVEVGAGGKATAKVSVDDVRLGSDGSLALDGARVSVRGQVSKLTGATSPDGATGAGSLSPAGTKSVADVQKMSAAEIAGAKPAAATSAAKPLDLVKHLEDGTFEVTVPIEGDVGPGAAGVTFAKGTTIKASLHVEDGKVIPSKSKVEFSQPGDGPLWVSVKGAYIDESGNVRASLGGLPDFKVMKALPLDVPALVDRFAPKPSTPQSGAQPAVQPRTQGVIERTISGATRALADDAKADAMAAIKLDQARIEVKDARFSGGKLALPGGEIDLADDGVRLSISATPKAAVISGRVAVDGVKIAQDGIALETGKGSMDLRIESSSASGAATVKTTLTNLDLDVKYAVQKRANGDYIQLADGRARGGSLSVDAKVPLDARGVPTGKPTSVGLGKLTLPSFEGRIEGGRVTVPDGAGTAQIELGRTRVKGSVEVDGKRILVKGEVASLDAAVQGFQTKPGSGTSASVDAARLRGAGKVTFSSETGLEVDASITSVDARIGSIKKPGNR